MTLTEFDQEKYEAMVQDEGMIITLNSLVVKVVDGCEAYIYDRWEKEYRRNDYYLKAMYDPGSEYDEITKEKAEEIIRNL